MKLPTIILLRHGQTLWNVEGRYQGQLNSNLTSLGKEQATNNALKIAKNIEDFSSEQNSFKFFSSPLGRAKETAYIICDTLGLDKKNIIFDSNIQEVNYGIFEGKTKEFCKVTYAKEFKEREANKWSYALEGGGESYEMVTKRIHLWLERVKDEEIVILVAHEMVNRALRGIYCSYDKEKMLKLRQKNDIVLKLENSQESIIE